MYPYPILVYADNQRLLGELPEQLRLVGYLAHTAQARDQFVWALGERQPAAVVLGDLPTLPATLALLRELRGREAAAPLDGDRDVPLLVVSASGGELCELAAFEAGADDFQTADVSLLVLRTRLAALIARSRATYRACRVEVGALRIDTSQREASYAGQQLELSKIEFALLHRLAREPQRVFTTAELLEQVWGCPAALASSSRTVTGHAARLRGKLAAAGVHGAIENRRGVGYRLGLLDDDPAPAA